MQNHLQLRLQLINLLIIILLLSFSVFAEEILSVCLIEDDKVLSKNSCYGTINIGEYFTYEGEFENGQLNGKGTFVWH